MRAFAALLFALVATAAVAGQNPAVPCGDNVYAPGTGPRSSFPPYSQSQNVSATGLGLLKCNAFELDCSMTVRKLYFDVAASTTNVQCSAGIYKRNATGGADALGRLPVLDCSDPSPVDTAAGGAALGGDLDNAVVLQPYTEYLGCIAFSIRGVSTVKYEAPRAVPLFVVGGAYSTYNGDLAVPANGVTELAARFNYACVGSGDPFACCTGSLTGTCPGLPASITLLTAIWTHGPILKLGR